MKLHKLIIKNFRGIKGDQNYICFEDSNIIFLIGQNNVGKSSFLNAYDFFVKSSQNASIDDFHNYDKTVPIEIEGWFLKELKDKDDTDLTGTGKSSEPDWITKWVNEENIVKVKKVWSNPDHSFEKYTFNPKSNTWTKDGFGGFHSKLQKYTPTPIFIGAIETTESFEKKVNDLINKKFLKQIETTNKEAYDLIKNAILKLQKEITNSNEVTDFNNELNTEFKKVFSNLTLQIKPKSEDGVDISKAFEKNHSIGVKKDGITREENFTQHGHGVIRQALFNFLKFLGRLENENSYLILFEEPEIFLHPKVAFNLRKSLYDLVKNSQFQILCSTHSPLMIDVSKPHSSLIRVVKKSDESTVTYQADQSIFQSDDEKKQLVQMINRLNPHICEAFYTDKVLVVEGDTETIIYRDFLNKFFPNEEIFVLNTGSKNNIPFFQDVLTHFRIEHYVIHDSDKKFNDDGSINSAWSLNEKIWKKIEEANKIQSDLARRYVHVHNFETANHYVCNKTKGKPLSAFEFSQTITDKDQDLPCLNWLRDIIGEKKFLHDQNYITSLKNES